MSSSQDSSSSLGMAPLEGAGFDESGQGAAPAEIVFSETTSASWLERLKGAFGGVIMGFCLILLSIGLLFWNEGRAVQTAHSLAEGAAGVISVNASSVNPIREGQLVHLSGRLNPPHKIGDEDFFLKADAVRLVRKTQIYQWREETRSESRKSLGGAEETVTTYTYNRVWSDNRIDSARFRRPDGHQNPEPRYRNREIIASDTTLGAFKPTDALLRRMSANEEFSVPAETLVHLRQRHGAGVQIVDGRIHLGSDPANPRVGDMIISYTIARPQTVSVIARQTGNALGEYQTRSGDPLMMIVAGEVAAGPMFAQADRNNSLMTWVLRGLGATFMYLGFCLIGRPFAVFADLIPLAGDILRVGLGFAAFALTAFLAPIVIALAWLWYRPLLSLGLIAAGCAAMIVMYGLSQMKQRTYRG